MASANFRNQVSAVHCQSRIRKKGNYDHVSVKARGKYLYIHVGSDGTIIARIEQVDHSHYGLSFRTHSGQWQPMPVDGTLDEVADGIVEMLTPYLEPI